MDCSVAVRAHNQEIFRSHLILLAGFGNRPDMMRVNDPGSVTYARFVVTDLTAIDVTSFIRAV